MPAERTVALTFDDLPAVGTLAIAEAEQCNCRILGALQNHGAPATGFVVERRGQEIGSAIFERILRAWLRDGHDLGNHTYSHLDFNDISLAQFEDELTHGEATFGKLLAARHQKPRYFRFPYNHTGNTEEKLAAVGALLRRRGYEIATCTIDTSDYVFGRAYDLIVARQEQQPAARLRDCRLCQDHTPEWPPMRDRAFDYPGMP